MAGRLGVLHMAPIRWCNAEVQYALDLAREMDRLGHRTAFLGLTGSPGVDQARRGGLATFEESGFNAKGLRAIACIRATARLVHLLRRHRFDAVEVHRSEGLPLIAWACRRVGVPVIRVRGDPRPVRSGRLNRLLYSRGLSGVVASNRSMETELRERLGELAHLKTILGGVDAATFSPEGTRVDLRQELALPADAFLVGILGRIGRTKGHQDFLDAAGQALGTEVNVAFVILAKDPTPKETELRHRVSADPLLRDRVGFAGQRRDLPAVLRGFDLGVVASTGSEANCRVGLEWMASRVPLLATRVGVLPDLVRDGRTGYLVAPGSSSDLAEKIVYLARDPAAASRLGRMARSRVLSHFTLERCARAHVAFLLEILREVRR